MLEIIAYTDGSCLGNPGVGGYAAVMQAKGKTKEIAFSCHEQTTNNRMELMAVISVIDWLNRVQKEPCKIQVVTDSQYIINCSKHSRKELTATSRKNADLWIELIEKGLKGKHQIIFSKVEGHTGDVFNERADKLAREQAVKARHKVYGKG